MEKIDKSLAIDLIKKYGEDRFYHACLRTSNHQQTEKIYKEINEKATKEQVFRFFNDFGLNLIKPQKRKWPGQYTSYEEETNTESLCRIIYGLFKYKKELAIRDKRLPDHLHNRIMLTEKNDWIEKYVETIKDEER